jgi:hypothetical protein
MELSYDQTRDMLLSLPPEQRHDVWLAGVNAGTFSPSTPDPAHLDENGELRVEYGDPTEVLASAYDIETRAEGGVSQPLPEEGAPQPPAPGRDDSIDLDQVTPKELRYRAQRPRGGEPARPHSFRLEDSLWRKATSRAHAAGFTMNYVTRALVAAYARGAIRIGDRSPVINVGLADDGRDG